MKLRKPKDPSEALYRRTVKSAAALTLGATGLFGALALLHNGEQAAKTPDLPMAKPGIGRNLEVIGGNFVQNTVATSAADIEQIAGWAGIGLSSAVSLGAIGVMINAACKLAPKKPAPAKEPATSAANLAKYEDYRVPTSHLSPGVGLYDATSPTLRLQPYREPVYNLDIVVEISPDAADAPTVQLPVIVV